MKFKCGEIVIKTTGGNKMTIFDKSDTGYKCIWFDDNSGHEKDFKENEIVSITDYKRLLKTEEREDKINRILNNSSKISY